MKPIPREIKAQDGKLTILWSDAHLGSYNCRELRIACRCAVCVDEWTHENLIHPDPIPGLVKPSNIEVVGNYALHFTWNDGHNSGIYSYDYLRDLCGCEDCRSKRGFDV